MNRALSFAFGLLMVAAGAVQGDATALVASAVAVVAVLLGLLVPAVSTVAVVVTAIGLAMSEPSVVTAAIAGLSAAAYLVLRHARAGDVAITRPTVLGAVCLSAAAVLGAAIPPGVPWVPLAAPLAVVVIYAVVVARLVSG